MAILSILVNHATVFYGFVAVDGWVHAPGDALLGVDLSGPGVATLKVAVAAEHMADDGHATGQYRFCLHGYLHQCPPPQARLLFTAQSGAVVEKSLHELVDTRYSLMGAARLHEQLKSAVQQQPGALLLDVGGRARSGIDYSLDFPSAHCTVFDINPGDNVQVVGDAHRLSQYFGAETRFDFVQSISVFEHLAQPWVVVAEINQVMKPGGLLFISSHQTIGMHDIPWDFWRFSDRAYHALLNEDSGFEVLAAELHEPAFIIPHLYIHSDHAGGEQATGYRSACVLARKIADKRGPVVKHAAFISPVQYPG